MCVFIFIYIRIYKYVCIFICVYLYMCVYIYTDTITMCVNIHKAQLHSLTRPLSINKPTQCFTPRRVRPSSTPPSTPGPSIRPFASAYWRVV